MTNDRRTDREERALDALFDVARSDVPEPSPDLLARVLSDAEAVQAGRLAETGKTPPRRRAVPGFWKMLIAAIGGWPSLGGVAAAGIAGLWIGLNPPSAIQDQISQALAETSGFEMLDDGQDALSWFGLDGVEEG